MSIPALTLPIPLLTFRLYISETQIPDTQGKRLVHMDQEILNRLAAIPGVSSVSFAPPFPWTDTARATLLNAQDHVLNENELPPVRIFKFISPGFFVTTGTKLIAGRDISWADTYNMLPVAIISEAFARNTGTTPQVRWERRSASQTPTTGARLSGSPGRLR